MPQNNSSIRDYLVELETKITFQEQMIEELNLALIQQQFALDKLQTQLRHIAEKLQGVGGNVASRSEETPPPHY